MNTKTRQALRMLQEHGDPAIGPGGGVVMSEASRLIYGQPWVHWRTAEALERAGLANVNWDSAGWAEENPEITLTAKGLDA